MGPPQAPHPAPAFVSVAPRFVVPDLGRALDFYEQLGFHTDYRDDGFAIINRDGVELHINQDPDLAPGKHTVCYVTVTESESLYQQYLTIGCVQGRLTVTEYGMREFVICDPFNNLLIFGEPIAARFRDSE
jgi:glyoxalase/bleomycin resistance protein/dioxygenase superfamily protein